MNRSPGERAVDVETSRIIEPGSPDERETVTTYTSVSEGSLEEKPTSDSSRS